VAAVAGARLSLDDAIAYARDRKVFGKPLVKREYWQQKIAELATKLEAARALTYKAADEYNDERYVKKVPVSFETVKLISMAKVFVGDVAHEVTDQAMQIHGGAGYIEEYPIARAYRDQRLFRIGAGTTETMRYYIAKLMGL
ncbi:acyl-CoA dehydrogenase, partial [bacterium]